MVSPNATPIAVALSGGVDSATAAALLCEAGHRVVGLTMRLYDARGTTAASSALVRESPLAKSVT